MTVSGTIVSFIKEVQADNFGTVVGENPYGISALCAVNGLSIVYWAVMRVSLGGGGWQDYLLLNFSHKS